MSADLVAKVQDKLETLTHAVMFQCEEDSVEEDTERHALLKHVAGHQGLQVLLCLGEKAWPALLLLPLPLPLPFLWDVEESVVGDFLTPHPAVTVTARPRLRLGLKLRWKLLVEFHRLT